MKIVRQQRFRFLRSTHSKIWKFNFLCILLSLGLTSIQSGASSADDGVGAGGGGDHYSAEFAAVGYELIHHLERVPLPEVNLPAFQKAVQSTKIHSQEHLYLQGHEVDAINYPDLQNPHIEMSRSAWDQMASNQMARVRLAFHEYLGILRLDDQSYQISHRLGGIGICDRSPVIRDELVRQIGLPCHRILPEDLDEVTELDLSKARGISALALGDLAFLYKLRKFTLDDEPLSDLPDGFFSGLVSLENVTLWQTGLQRIRRSMFSGLTGLKNLAIRWYRDSGQDGIQSIEPGAFEDFPSHAYLTIAVRPSFQLPDGFFKTVKAGTSIQLEDAKYITGPVRTLGPQTLAGLEWAPIFNSAELFGSQRPVQLSKGVFAPLQSVRSVSLDFDLTGLEPPSAEVFQDLPSELKTLYLQIRHPGAFPLDFIRRFKHLDYLLVLARFDDPEQPTWTDYDRIRALVPHLECHAYENSYGGPRFKGQECHQ